MITRLTISFTPAEREALRSMAEIDFRPPKDQLRYLLCQEARKRGLLPSVDCPVESQASALEVD